MTGSLKQSYNMTKPHSINLKNISLGWFLLFYVLAPTKSIATSNVAHDNEGVNNEAINHNNEAIDHDNANINPIALIQRIRNQEIRFIYIYYKSIRDFHAAFYIVYSTCISLYNYFTGHNKRKSKWYLHEFFLYAGRKINITKNFYLDLSFNLLIFSFYLFLFNRPRPRNVEFNMPRNVEILLTCAISLLTSIQLCINIRIYKNFYLSFDPKGAITVFIYHIMVTDYYNKNSHIINHQVN